METKDFGTQIRELNGRMLDEIRSLVRNSEGIILIPYYYEDESYIDDDIEQLIEDEYLVSEGDSEDNLSISLNEPYQFDIEVVAVHLGNHFNPNAVVLVDKEQNSHSVEVDENPYMIAYLLKKLREIME